MVGYTDVERAMKCRYCGYFGKGWYAMHVRMTVESAETFYMCPKCGMAN